MLFVSIMLMHVMGDVQASFLNSRYENYAAAGHRDIHAFEDVVSFVDDTKIKMSRLCGTNTTQRLAYKGHKRAHAINV